MKRRLVCLCMALVLTMLSAVGAGASDQITLTYWTVNNENDMAYQQPVIDKFMEETGYKVEANNAFSGWPDFWTKLMTAIAGGTAPDIIRMKETHTAELFSRGALLDISKYVEADPTINPEDFFDAMWQTVRFDDGVYGLPMMGNIIVLFYNKDIFDAYGYTEAPKTWDELLEYSTAMTDPSKGQFGFMWYELGVREPCFAWWYGFYLMAGGEFWKDGVVGGEVQLNNEAGVKALQLQIDMLYSDKSAVPPSVTATSLAENGKVAMWMQGSWNLGGYPRTAPQLNWACAPLPGDVTDAHNALVDNCGVMAQTEHPDEAYALISALCGIDGDYAFNAGVGQIPTHKANAGKEPYASDANYQVVLDAYMLPATQPKPLCVGYEEMGVALATELQKCWFNQVTPEQCLASCEEVANGILARVNGR